MNIFWVLLIWSVKLYLCFVSVVGIVYIIWKILENYENRYKWCGLFSKIIKRVIISFMYVIFSLLLVLIVIPAFIILRLSGDLTKKIEDKYDEVDEDKLKPGDIIMIGHSEFSLSTVLIKLANIFINGMQSRDWTHIAIHIKDGRLIEATSDHGVKYNSLNFYSGKCLIKVFRHKYLDENKNSVFFNNLIIMLEDIVKSNTQYGFCALFFYALSIGIPNIFNFVFDDPFFDKKFHIENAYFCSELVAEVYKECGQPISQYDAWRIKPSDFIKNPMFEDVTVETSK